MKDDIMMGFEYDEVDSLKRLVKRYGKVISEQEDLIRKLQARLDGKQESFDREGMIANLEAAQEYLSEVYHAAIEAGLTEIESQMSCADSCIGEAISALDDNQENLFSDWFGSVTVCDSTPYYTSCWYCGWCYWCII